MNKMLFAIAMASSIPAAVSAQSAIDALNLSQTDMRGTARFMAMGGAFTALGGDLSTLTQNPGGIGIYRSSEIGVTLDLNFQRGTSLTQGFNESIDRTKFNCNNFGYIGSVNTSSEVMPYFSWGASYNRAASFDRHYTGSGSLNGSLSNYIAGFTSAEGYPTNDLLAGTNSWNPYYDSSAPWSSILFYNSYLINPTSPVTDDPQSSYAGLWQKGISSGTGAFDVQESGYVDEYSINFGGNFVNTVYWGIGFGITDIEFKQNVYYEEDINNALIMDAAGNNTITGNGGFGLEGLRRISGNGFNFKAGLIIKPVNEFRIGLAIHTPTYYNLTQYDGGSADYGMSSGYSGVEYANDSYANVAYWKLRTPLRFMAGVAGVIGHQAIVSLDYEYRAYSSMSTRNDNGREYTELNGDIDNWYKDVHAIRLGAEYRLTPSWSVRAGYGYETSPVNDRTRNNGEPIYTSGIDETGLIPSYAFPKSSQNISLGFGYRYKNFYIDATYVNNRRTSEFHAYTPNAYTDAALQSDVTVTNNNAVLSVGIKF